MVASKKALAWALRAAVATGLLFGGLVETARGQAGNAWTRGRMAYGQLTSRTNTSLPVAALLAQGLPPARTPDLLRKDLDALLSPLGVTVDDSTFNSQIAGSQELRIRLSRGAVIEPSGTLRGIDLVIVARLRRSDRVPRYRSLDLAEGQLMVAAVDKVNRLRSWAVVADPRILRAEWPKADGVLEGRTLATDSGEFLVSIPDDSRLSSR